MNGGVKSFRAIKLNPIFRHDDEEVNAVLASDFDREVAKLKDCEKAFADVENVGLNLEGSLIEAREAIAQKDRVIAMLTKQRNKETERYQLSKGMSHEQTYHFIQMDARGYDAELAALETKP